jgi:hypothetical protein
MPSTSSADRLAAATEDLLAALERPHLSTPFLNLGTATNDAIKKLQSIYLSPRDVPSRRVVETDIPSPRVQTGVSSPRVLSRTTTRLRSILEENEIFLNGTEIMKKIKGNKIHQGQVTSHDEDREIYRIDYTNGDWEEMNRKQVNRIPALVPLTAPLWGPFVYGGVFPSKIGPIAHS